MSPRVVHHPVLTTVALRALSIGTTAPTTIASVSKNKATRAVAILRARLYILLIQCTASEIGLNLL